MFLPDLAMLLALFGSLGDPTVQGSIILSILGGILGFLGFVVLLVIGILVIIMLAGLLIVLLPAILVAIIIWFFTGSLFFAGIAFLVVALLSLITKI